MANFSPVNGLKFCCNFVAITCNRAMAFPGGGGGYSLKVRIGVCREGS